jgi:hypothetical protein
MAKNVEYFPTQEFFLIPFQQYFPPAISVFGTAYPNTTTPGRARLHGLCACSLLLLFLAFFDHHALGI